jgi:hypothetical protein
VIASAGGVMVKEKDWLTLLLSLSVSRTTKGKISASVGVPLSTPAELKVNPVGSDPPATDHVYGSTPPVPDSVCEYGAPTVPSGKTPAVTIVSKGGLMAKENDFVALTCLLSVTSITKGKEPAVVGVPVRLPSEFKVNPGGMAPPATDHAYGGMPPLADSVAKYVSPTFPTGSVLVVIVGGEGLIASSKTLLVVTKALSLTCTWRIKVPAAVAVPVRVPEELRTSPGGAAPSMIAHPEYGGVPPEALNVSE